MKTTAAKLELFIERSKETRPTVRHPTSNDEDIETTEKKPQQARKQLNVKIIFELRDDKKQQMFVSLK